MTEYLIRELKRNTELLILAEYIKDPAVKRREIAERLGVTEQAVSQYVADLEKEELLSSSQGRTKPTRKGVQMLQERFLRLNEEIKTILRQIQVIDSCIAIAGAQIEPKEKVGLFMRDGRLVALPNRQADSTGVAKNAAEKGEEVLVGNLEGVVEMELGSLMILQVPQETSGGSKGTDLALASKTMKGFDFDEVAVGDLIGEVVARKLHLQSTISHAPTQATVNALSKGLDVLFIGTRDSSDELLAAVERLKNQTGYSISFKLAFIGKEG